MALIATETEMALREKISSLMEKTHKAEEAQSVLINENLRMKEEADEEQAALAGENKRLKEELGVFGSTNTNLLEDLENSNDQLKAMEELTVSLTNENKTLNMDLEQIRLQRAQDINN